MNEARAFEDRQETSGRQQAEARMLPAQQSFETDQAARGNIDARLVMEHELVTDERMTQANFEFLSLRELGVERG